VDWGRQAFGDPCRECGYRWDTSTSVGVASVAGIGAEFRIALRGSDGDVTHPELSWSAKGYVLHVADNLRIWAERLEARVAGAAEVVATYDDNSLAIARNYEGMSMESAWVALDHAVAQWLEAVRKGLDARPTLRHPERGLLSIDDVIATNCHDARHHLWDVRRTLASEDLAGDTD
jgi:hypothetical protein